MQQYNNRALLMLQRPTQRMPASTLPQCLGVPDANYPERVARTSEETTRWPDEVCLLASQLPQYFTILAPKTPCAGAHVHAGGLLVGAEQRRRARDLDHLDPAALGVGGAGQALVGVRGALVLRAARMHNLSAVQIKKRRQGCANNSALASSYYMCTAELCALECQERLQADFHIL